MHRSVTVTEFNGNKAIYERRAIEFPDLLFEPEFQELLKLDQLNILDLGCDAGIVLLMITINFKNHKVTGIDSRKDKPKYTIPCEFLYNQYASEKELEPDLRHKKSLKRK